MDPIGDTLAGPVESRALQRVMSPTAATIHGTQLGAQVRQCAACFDYVVGPAVQCDNCGGVVHAHCMQVFGRSPVCVTCIAERDAFVAARRSTMIQHGAQQFGRALASGGQLAGQVVGATAFGLGAGVTRLASGVLAGARQTMGGVAEVPGPVRPRVLPALQPADGADPPGVQQFGTDIAERMAAMEAELVRLRAENAQYREEFEIHQSGGGGYATPGAGSAAGRPAPSTPQPTSAAAAAEIGQEGADDAAAQLAAALGDPPAARVPTDGVELSAEAENASEVQQRALPGAGAASGVQAGVSNVAGLLGATAQPAPNAAVGGSSLPAGGAGLAAEALLPPGLGTASWPWSSASAPGGGQPGGGGGGQQPQQPQQPWPAPGAAAASAAQAPQFGGLGMRGAGGPPPPPPFGATTAAGDFAGGAAPADAAGLAAILSRLKGDEVPKLSWTGVSKASKYEEWLQKNTVYFESVHPQVEAWWCNLRAAVDASYDEYLHVDPLQRPCICPQTSWAEVGTQRQVEYKYRPYLLQAMPESIVTQALATRQLSCSELVFAVCVEAGPGTSRDRAATLKAVERRGNPAAPARGEVYIELQRWKFDLTRLQRLGAVAPDPTI